MVRQNHVQHQRFEARREVGQAVHGALGQGRADLDVAQKLALDRIFEACSPGKLAYLADVVEQDAGEHQVAMEDGVMRDNAVSQGQQADHVLQQASEPGVVELLGGRSFAISGSQSRVREDCGDQTLQVGLGEAVDKAEKLGPECGHVIAGRGQQVCLVRLAVGGLAELVNLQLHGVFEAGSAAADLDDVAALEVTGDARIVRVPDAAFHRAGLVAQSEAEIGLVGRGGALLPGQDQKEPIEEFALVEGGKIGDINVFHRDNHCKHRASLAQNRLGKPSISSLCNKARHQSCRKGSKINVDFTCCGKTRSGGRRGFNPRIKPPESARL